MDVVSTSEEGTRKNLLLLLLLLRTSLLTRAPGGREGVGRLFAFKDRPVFLMAEHIYLALVKHLPHREASLLRSPGPSVILIEARR